MNRSQSYSRQIKTVSKADTCCIDSVQYKSILMPNVLKSSFLCFGMGLYKIGRTEYRILNNE